MKRIKLTNLSIKMQLAAGFCLMLVISCGVIGLLSYNSATRVLQDTIDESLMKLAMESGKYVRLYLDREFLALEGVANRHVVQSMEWEKSQKPALENETKRLGYLGMGIVYPDGTARYPDGSTANLGDRDYVKAAFTGKTTISDVIVSRVTNQSVVMVAAPIYKSGSKEVAAVLIARKDGLFLSSITDGIRYGKKGYSYIINHKGELIAHDNREFVLTARNFLEEGKTKAEFRSLSEMFQLMVKGETGYSEYWFMGSYRFFGYAPIPGTGWSIAAGAQKAEVFAGFYEMRLQFFIYSGLILFAGLVFAFFFASGISRPVRRLADGLRTMAGGDFTVKLVEKDLKRGDEIGQLSMAAETLIENIRGMITEIAGNSHTVASSATELSEISAQASQSVKTMTEKTSSAAAAAEESSANTTSVAVTMEQATANLTSVASATEEMSATIGEIAANSEKARAISSDAANQATAVSALMQHLGQAAREIGQVTETITEISSQTNLLALNATIEAARAGAAGRGFAVVANEIKELAKQTAQATEDIKAKIGGVQTSAGGAIVDIEKITGVIGDVGQIIASIATAIEEQSAVTRDVAGNIAEASAGVRESNERVAQTALVSKNMAQDLARVAAAAGEIRAGGDQIQSSAAELSKLAEQLKELVGRFKV